MKKRILIDAKYPKEIRGVVVQNGVLEDFEYESCFQKQIKGNIYLAKISRIEPSLQAAFIDFGNEKNGFLPFNEIHPSYYSIPVDDRAKLGKVYESGISEIQVHECIDEDNDEVKVSSDITPSDEDEIDIDKYADPQLCEDNNHYNEKEHSESKNVAHERYKIHEVIKPGQIILVQAQKEPRGNKGASFTSFISLAGKYCVLMTNKFNHDGISRRVDNLDERNRLKSIVASIKGPDKESQFSLIIRTAGIGRSSYEIKRDYNYLANLWNKIRSETLKATAPAFIHMEEGILQRIIRDTFNNSISDVIVEGDDAYEMSKKIMHHLSPKEVKRIKLHKHKKPIFSYYNVEENILNLYKPHVDLPSGGYIIINPTEALTAIDVNSGKSNMERTIEQTALRTNMEAVKEIAKHIKIRDISGLIVIDFIDMMDINNRKIVERCFKDFTSKDSAKIQSHYISTLGLMEVSRQRVKSSFLDVNSKMCDHCQGKGVVRSDNANSLVLLRTIEAEISNSKSKHFNIVAHTDAINFINNNRKQDLLDLEDKFSIKLNLFCDPKAHADSFYIEKMTNLVAADNKLPDLQPLLLPNNFYVKEESNHEVKKKPIKRKIRKAKDNTANQNQPEQKQSQQNN